LRVGTGDRSREFGSLRSVNTKACFESKVYTYRFKGSIETCEFGKPMSVPSGVFEWYMLVESVIRRFGESAPASVEESRYGCSIVSVIRRFRFAVSGLCLMAGSGHSTESFLVEEYLELWTSSLGGAVDMAAAESALTCDVVD
jgi:hypothetical protein